MRCDGQWIRTVRDRILCEPEPTWQDRLDLILAIQEIERMYIGDFDEPSERTDLADLAIRMDPRELAIHATERSRSRRESKGKLPDEARQDNLDDLSPPPRDPEPPKRRSHGNRQKPIPDHPMPDKPKPPDPSQMRTCTGCGETKHLSEFWPITDTKHPSQSQFSDLCKPCETTRHREPIRSRWIEHPEDYRRISLRERMERRR